MSAPRRVSPRTPGVLGLALLAGPPIGGLALGFFLVVSTLMPHGDASYGWRTVLFKFGETLVESIVMAFSLAYVFGLAPALVGGLLFVVADSSLPSAAPRDCLAIASGGFVTPVYVFALGRVLAPHDGSGAVYNFRDWMLFWGFDGAFAAWICYLIGIRVGLFAENGSNCETAS